MERESQAKVEWKTLKDVCISATSGGTPLSSNRKYYEGDIPWLRTQEVDWKDVYDTEFKITEEAVAHSSAKLVPKNCVIVAMYGATAAKVCVNKIPLTTNQACCNLQIDEKVAHYKYVFYWLAKEYENLKSLAVGGQANLSAEIIKGYKIPVPSVIEQERIAVALSSVDELIASLDKQIAKTRDIRQGVMQQLLNSPTEYAEFSKLCSFVRGVTYNKSQERDADSDGYRVLRANNITLQNNALNFGDIKVIDKMAGVRQEQFLYQGDILICAGSGSKEHVGKVAYIDEDMNYCFGGFMGVVRVNEKIKSKYLFYVFTSSTFKEYLEQAVACCTINNINSSLMNDFPIPVVPLAEQEHIASVLTSFDDTIEGLEAKRQKYESIKAGMMQQLLTGATCSVNS